MRSVPLLLIVLSVSFPSLAAEQHRREKVLLASDKKTEITIPSTWEEMELNEAAEIQVGNEKESCFIIVLNEAKEDLYGWNIEKHSRVTLGSLLSSVSLPTVVGPKSLTINGSPAVQYEVRGATENRNVIYLHTTVEGPIFFSQILAWTVPSQAEVAKSKLMKAIASFKESKPPRSK